MSKHTNWGVEIWISTPQFGTNTVLGMLPLWNIHNNESALKTSFFQIAEKSDFAGQF